MKKTILSLLGGILILSSVYSRDEWIIPHGATTAQDLFAPPLAGMGGFSTSRGGSGASALNPAAEGEAQRIIFDAGYLALPRFGDDQDLGLGAINLGAIIPTRYGVFGGSARLLSSPYEAFPIDNSLLINVNAAKEIYPQLSLGAGLNLGFYTGNNWIISGDLGFRYNMGDLGPLGDFTWAITARSLGISWVPHAFTPAAGVAFDVLRIRGQGDAADPIKIRLAADLLGPGVQNLAGKLGLNLLIAERITVGTSTQFNIRETMDNAGPSPIPSIGVGVNFQLQTGGRRLMADRLPSDGDLQVNLAAKPLYEGIWAMGGGLTWHVGRVDTNPPRILIDYEEPQWFAPNNTGQADFLEIPLSITDERFVVEWTFEIQDEEGRVLRTIRNRELRPETQGIHNFFDRLLAVKTMVEVPPVLRWDGVYDNGDLAQDGIYYFTISAVDDSGNAAAIGPFPAHVDLTPPEIVLRPFVNQENIFSPGGGGDKDSLTIGQRGSVEDLWEGGIYNSLGQRIRTFRTTNASPADTVWDGTNDDGEIAADGVYSYRISARDRAQNFSEAALGNIVVNTQRPEVGLSIRYSHFSPNGDGIQDSQILSLHVPVQEGIVAWSLEIVNQSNLVQRTYSDPALPETLEFNGLNQAGRPLAEGEYRALLLVRYQNGLSSQAESAPFILDISPPRATVRGQGNIFSPFNPDSPLREMVISQEIDTEIPWVGEIHERGGPVVRTFRFSPGALPERISWDGLDDSGTLVGDGFYTYVLSGTDLAGNPGRSNVIEFEVDTRDTPVVLATDYRAFSPTGNSPRTSLNLLPQLKESEGVESWRIDIRETGTGSLVRTLEGSGALPPAIPWNGRNNGGLAAADGSYTAQLEVLYRNGNRPRSESSPFRVDTVPPQGELSAPYTIFAPNGNGRRESLPLTVRTGAEDTWTAEIRDRNNNIVRTWTWTGAAPENFEWDGRDQAGNIASDGTYSFAMSAEDEAGNRTRHELTNLVLDARIPRIFLTASAEAISPRPGAPAAAAGPIRFEVINSLPEGIESWVLEFLDEGGRVIQSLPSPLGGTGPIPSNLSWNGRTQGDSVEEGYFTPTLRVSYAKGDEVSVSSSPILVDVSGPVLSFRSSPQFFSPDNDGVDDELFIYLGMADPSPIADWSLEFYETEGTEQLFYRTNGRGTAARELIWDGRSNRSELVQGATDYRYLLRASDVLGNTSVLEGYITTDVLVIRDGDMLRIQIPSITFRANHADFIDIGQERLDNNEWVLRRVAEILNRFRDYRIIVEGHANPVLGTAREETEELQPLSLARSRFVI